MSLFSKLAGLALALAMIGLAIFATYDRSIQPPQKMVSGTETAPPPVETTSTSERQSVTSGSPDQPDHAPTAVLSADEIDYSAQFHRQPAVTDCSETVWRLVKGVEKPFKNCISTEVEPNQQAANLKQLQHMEKTEQDISPDGMEVLYQHYFDEGDVDKGIDWAKRHAIATGKAGLLHDARSKFSAVKHPLIEYEMIAILVETFPTYEQKMLTKQRASILAGLEGDEYTAKEEELDDLDDQVETFVNGLPSDERSATTSSTFGARGVS